MQFEKGNQWWKMRSKHGRDKLFASPELLWESACEYFEWCDANPWVSKKISENEKGEFSETRPTQRPYSLKGWFLYIGCSETWLINFKANCTSDYLRVIEEVEMVIAKQQWEGATVGAFKENIIARTLGLKDASDITTNGKELPANNVISVEIVQPKKD
jgi:hypothetical protein